MATFDSDTGSFKSRKTVHYSRGTQCDVCLQLQNLILNDFFETLRFQALVIRITWHLFRSVFPKMGRQNTTRMRYGTSSSLNDLRPVF